MRLVEQLQQPDFSTDTRRLVLDDIDYSHGDSQVVPKSMVVDSTVVVQFPDRILTPEASQSIEISPDLPKNSPLEEAGFLLYRQMENFLVTGSTEELLENMRSHTNEYPLRRPLLRGKVRLTEKGVVNSYNNELVKNHLDFAEREGATANGFLDLDTKAQTAKNGDLIVQVSPMGWNGIYQNYEDTQIVIYKIKDKKTGELEQLTFVLKGYQLEECVSLLCALGVDRQMLVGKTEQDTIKNVVGQAHLLPSEVKRAEDLLGKVKESSIRPNNPIFDAVGRYLNLLDQGVDISKLPPACEQMLNNVRDFIGKNAHKFAEFASQLQLSDLVEETLYQIGEYVLGYSQKGTLIPVIVRTSPVSAKSINRQTDWRDKYQTVIEKLQQIGGCAGGGRRLNVSIRSVISGTAFRSEGSSSGGATGEYHVGTCGKCGNSNVLVGECQICTTCEKGMVA